MQKHLKLLALEVGALRLYDLTSQTVNILLEVRDSEMLYIITNQATMKNTSSPYLFCFAGHRVPPLNLAWLVGADFQWD